MKRDVKQAIIDATIQLINERGSNLADITIRDICQEAGVGVGLINYHFQSKENLIARCVQILVGDVIGQFDALVAALPPLSPMDRLKRMVNGTLTYLATHENISRISILTDMNTPGQGDNTQQTVQVFLPLVAEVLKPAGREAEAKAKTYQMIMAFQGLFLRAHLLNEELGFSLFDSLQREAFIDAFIDDFFAGCTPPEL